jgi:CRP-like cAMP-binding protein
MIGMKVPEKGAVDFFERNLRNLNPDCGEGQRLLRQSVKKRSDVRRGEDIVRLNLALTQVTVLLAGVACLYKLVENGDRQIYSFYYSGDFCDLHRYVSLQPSRELAVRALTDCSIGTIEYEDLDLVLERDPNIALAFWRATMLESSIVRERLTNISRRPALKRVSHLLCEQLYRRRAISIDSNVIPLNQIEVADAAGLSVVHVNRIFQELRKLGVLAKSGGTIEVMNSKRLAAIAGFDARYLNLPVALAGWKVNIE